MLYRCAALLFFVSINLCFFYYFIRNFVYAYVFRDIQ